MSVGAVVIRCFGEADEGIWRDNIEMRRRCHEP